MFHALGRSNQFFAEWAARTCVPVQPDPPSPYVLDAISATVAGAYWIGGCLRSAYSGPILKAYRVSDAAELDVNKLGSGLIDTQAIIDFGVATSSNVLLKNLNDQSVNALHLTPQSATVSKMPVLYTHGVGLTLGAKGFLAAKHLVTNLTQLTRASALGFSGSPEMHVAWDSNETASASRTTWRLGGIGTNRLFNRLQTTTTASISLTTSEQRQFSTPSGGSSAYVMQHPAGATLENTTLRRNGIELNEWSISGGSTVWTLANSGLQWSGYLDSTGFLNGRTSHLIFISSVLSTPDRLAIEQWQAGYRS